MSANQRRALFYQNDSNHDCSVHFDVNEYLIEAWPTLPERGRKAVWTLAQNDEEFDFTSIEEQIDDYVYTYAESSTDWNLPVEEEEVFEDENEENNEDDEGWYLNVDLYDYYQQSWKSLTPEQIDEVVELAYYDESIDWQPIYQQLDAIAASVFFSPKSPLPSVDPEN